MSAPTSGCLFSIVKNTSGDTKHFGFLPPHGRTLDDNEELHVFGDITTAIYRNGGHKSRRTQDALATAVNDGDLTIKSSACVIVYDTTDLASYRLGTVAGDFHAFTPDWDSDTYASI